jgi:hypothetical protein
MVTKRAVTMAIRVAGKDEGNNKGSKSHGNGAKRAIAKKRVMASNDNNKMMATETTTQHCCLRHHCPCLSHWGSCFFGAWMVAGNNWWWRMRTKVGAQVGGGELCVEF